MIKNFLKSHSIHKDIVPFFDIIMILRLTLFFGVWSMVCIGMYIGSFINGETQVNITDYNLFTIILFTGISFICGSIFIINQINDLESDTANNKAIIIGQYITKKTAVLVSNAICGIGFLLICVVDYAVAFPVMIMYLVCGRLYSNETINAKSNLWMGLAFYLTLGYLLILSGVVYNRYDSSIIYILVESLVYTIPFLLAYISVALVINILDSSGDRLVGRETCVTSFGIRATSILACFLCLVSFIIAIYLSDPLSSVSSLSAIPFFLFLVFRGKDKDILRSIRYPVLLLNFYVLTIYPLLFFPVISTYYITKYYYWHRFSIHYPTLLVEND